MYSGGHMRYGKSTFLITHRVQALKSLLVLKKNKNKILRNPKSKRRKLKRKL
jgi:uncharacterized protein YaaQ